VRHKQEKNGSVKLLFRLFECWPMPIHWSISGIWWPRPNWAWTCTA